MVKEKDTSIFRLMNIKVGVENIDGARREKREKRV